MWRSAWQAVLRWDLKAGHGMWWSADAVEWCMARVCDTWDVGGGVVSEGRLPRMMRL